MCGVVVCVVMCVCVVARCKLPVCRFKHVDVLPAHTEDVLNVHAEAFWRREIEEEGAGRREREEQEKTEFSRAPEVEYIEKFARQRRHEPLS